MKAYSLVRHFGVLAVLVLCGAAFAQGGNGLLLVVNSTADASDAAAGDGVCADASGKCTLRAAIEESNATASSSAIIFDLPKPSVIDLTLGELLILKSTSIAGPNARQLTIRRSTAPGTANFRVLHVAPGRIGLIVRGMTIGNGSSDGPGGAIYVESGAFLNFFDSAATGNRAANGGGIASAGRLNVLRSLINGNYANEGGGVALLEGAIESSITASTLTDNNAVVSGGIDNRGNLALINDTISGNKASTASSISNVATATVGVLNTIIGRDSGDSALLGTFQSAGSNIVTNARNSSGFTNGVNADQVSDTNSIDPLLGPLADNGGPTDTLALLPGSPAIDNANVCAAAGQCTQLPNVGIQARKDQRRRLRNLFGKMDIGAYEDNPGNATSSGSFGLIPFPQNARFLNSIVVLIDVATFEKRYSVVGPAGIVRATNVDTDAVYALQVLAKRSGAFGPAIIAFD